MSGIELICVREAARFLDVNPETIRDYIRDGRIKATKKVKYPGTRCYQYFLNRSDVEEFSPPHAFNRYVPNLSAEVRRTVAWVIAAEGTISINPKYSKNAYGHIRACPCLLVANTEESFTREFSKLVGVGNIVVLRKKTTGLKNVFRWELKSVLGCLRVLEQIYEYLPIKREQAKFVMEFCRSRLSHFNKPYTRREVELINEVRLLNGKSRSQRFELIDPAIYNTATSVSSEF